jgi:hypothetical protein
MNKNFLYLLILCFSYPLISSHFLYISDPQTISEEYQDSWLPSVGIDSTGNGFCLWRALLGNSQRSVVKRFDKSSMQWAQDIQLLSRSIIFQGAYAQKIVLNEQGNAWAIWQQLSGDSKTIHVSRFQKGADWWAQNNSLVLSDATKDSYMPVVAMNDKGNAIASWMSDNRIYARLAFQSDWSDPVVLSDVTAADPFCCINDNGTCVVVWQRFVVDHYQIEAAYYNQGAWQTGFVLSDGTRNAYNPKVAVDGQGNAVATWFEDAGGILRIYISEKNNDNPWQTSMCMSDTLLTAKFPTISINQAGQVMLMWEQYNGEFWHIASRYKDLNSSWSDEVAVSSTDNDAFDPQVVVDTYGNALATWTFYDDTTIKRIQISRYDAKSSQWLGTDVPLLLSDSHIDSQSCKLALNSKGDFIVAWQKMGEFIWNVQALYGMVQAPVVHLKARTLSRLPRVGTFSNVIEWFSLPDALYYEIYAADNVTLKARLSGNCLRYIDHCINPCESQMYFIYGIDSQGMYSMPAIVTIK